MKDVFMKENNREREEDGKKIQKRPFNRRPGCQASLVVVKLTINEASFFNQSASLLHSWIEN